MSIPVISVIVPVYNVEEYLDCCIKSIVKQTYNELEIILIDDGSTDSSGSICDKYSKSDSRIVVIHKENGGVSSSRNAGLDNATGEYLAFVDADDYVEEQYIEKLYNACIKHSADMSICDYYDFDENKVYNSKDNKSYERIIDKDNLLIFDSKSNINGVALWNKLYKTSLFKGLRFPENRVCEDTAVSYNVVYKASKIVHLQEKLYWYRSREGSIMHSALLPTEQALIGFDEFLTFCKEKIDDDLYKDKCIKMITKNKANTILENYYLSRKRNAFPDELVKHEKLFYEVNIELERLNIKSIKYTLFMRNKTLFYHLVDLYYLLFRSYRI